MVNKLLASTALAVGMVAIASPAHAEGSQIRFFGGVSMPQDFNASVADIVGVLAPDDADDINYYLDYYLGSEVYEDIDFDFDTGFVVGVGAGVHVTDFLLMEAEIAYRSADLAGYSYSYAGEGGPYIDLDFSGDIGITSIMTNAWYEFPTQGQIGGYVGGGIGMAKVDLGLSASVYYYDGESAYYYVGGSGGTDTTEFAWQLGGGVNMKTDSGFTFGLGYRYFNTSEVADTGYEFSSHDVIFEVTKGF